MYIYIIHGSTYIKFIQSKITNKLKTSSSMYYIILYTCIIYYIHYTALQVYIKGSIGPNAILLSQHKIIGLNNSK